MILDRLDRAAAAYPLHPLFAEAFAYLQAFDPATPDGRIDLRGDDLFVNVQRYTTKPAAETRFEAHRQYLDIQTIYTGEEAIYIDWLDHLQETEAFDADKDVAFYEGSSATCLSLRPGDFAILYPTDAHRPVCQVRGPSDVLKVVAKVRIEAAL